MAANSKRNAADKSVAQQVNIRDDYKRGREKGSKNVPKGDIKAMLMERNYDPLMDLLEQRLETDDPILKFNLAKEIVQYAYPKLRATDLKLSGDLSVDSPAAKDTMDLFKSVIESMKRDRK